MVGSISPVEKMSLRRTIKPPKAFTGDIIDDLSSSIHGDRTIDESDMEQKHTRTPLVLASERSLELGNHSEKMSPIKSTRTRTSSTARVKAPKPSRYEQGESEPMSRGRPQSRPGIWRPGAGMTPVNNKKYLGPQTVYNPNLPAARFPTYTSDQYLEDKAAGRNITPNGRGTPRPDADGNGSVTEYEETPPSSADEQVQEAPSLIEYARNLERPSPSHQTQSTLLSRPTTSISSRPTQSIPSCQTHGIPLRPQALDRPLFERVPDEQGATAEEFHRIMDMVTARLHADPSLQAGTALTGGSGSSGLSERELQSQRFMHDMTFEEWTERNRQAADVEADGESSGSGILDDNIFGDGFVSQQRRDGSLRKPHHYEGFGKGGMMHD